MEEIQELYYVGADSDQGKEKDEDEDSEEDTKNSEDESEEELNSKTFDKEDTEDWSEDSEDELAKGLNSKTSKKEDSKRQWRQWGWIQRLCGWIQTGVEQQDLGQEGHWSYWGGWIKLKILTQGSCDQI